MPELDAWVTKYKGQVCDEAAYHIYRTVKGDGFDAEQIFVGAQLRIDEATYEVCGLDAVAIDEGTWYLVYAHYVPQKTSAKEWNGLYGDPELANSG